MKIYKTITILAIFITFINAFTIAPKGYNGKVKFIKVQKLNYHFEDAKFAELSDLAYSPKTSTLYMVSDKGSLFAFRAKFSNTDYKLTPIKGYKLRSRKGKRLKRWKRDSEGLALDSQNNLYISFEGKPKVFLVSKTGQKLIKIHLPKELKKRNLRSRNKSLEALAWHPKYGLLTALEYPKKGDAMQDQTIYSINGKKWHLKMEPVRHNAITAIEVMDDGNLLILERAYNGFFGKFQVNLVKMYIKGCKPNTFCKKEKLLTIDSAKGWTVENFEGLSRVGKNRYLMISDDNDGFLMPTVLVYFEVK